MFCTVSDIVEDILKVFDEAKKYSYPDFIVKQDLTQLVEQYTQQVEDTTCRETEEALRAQWENSDFDYYVDLGPELEDTKNEDYQRGDEVV